jgi:hypothetical protein
MLAILLEHSTKFCNTVIICSNLDTRVDQLNQKLIDFIVQLAHTLPPGKINSVSMKECWGSHIKWFKNSVLLTSQLAYLADLSAIEAVTGIKYSAMFYTHMINYADNCTNVISNSKDLMMKFMILTKQTQHSSLGRLNVVCIADILSFLGAQLCDAAQANYPGHVALKIQAKSLKKHLLALPNLAEIMPTPVIKKPQSRMLTYIVPKQYFINTTTLNDITIKHESKWQYLIAKNTARLVETCESRRVLYYTMLLLLEHHCSDLIKQSLLMFTAFLMLTNGLERFKNFVYFYPVAINQPLQHGLIMIGQVLLFVNSLQHIAASCKLSEQLNNNLGAILPFALPIIRAWVDELMVLVCDIIDTPEANSYENSLRLT